MLRLTRFAVLGVMSMAGGPAFASPISMLDPGGAAVVTGVKLSGLPTIDANSTVRPIAPLALPPSLPQAAQPFDDGAAAAPPLRSASSSPGALLPSRAAPAPDTSAVAGSLREVLHSIVTLHESDRNSAPQQSDRHRPLSPVQDIDQDELNVDLRKLVLDSEVAGSLLRSIVEIKSTDAHGATFSILGLGNFALDVAPDLHDAIVSELSSGMVFRVSLTGEGRSYEGLYPQATISGDSVGRVPHERMNLVRMVWQWILDFLNSVVGALVSMAVAIALFLWIGVKSVGFLQRRASRYEHL
jgi:hypothetical protein